MAHKSRNAGGTTGDKPIVISPTQARGGVRANVTKVLFASMTLALISGVFVLVYFYLGSSHQ